MSSKYSFGRKALHNDILDISHKVYVEILPHDFLDFTGNGEPSIFILPPLKEEEQETFLNPEPPSG